MVNFVYDPISTYKEWLAISNKWSKPTNPPTRKMGDLTDDDVLNKVVTCYPDNKDRAERDVVLIRRTGASTPDPVEDFWVSGASSFLDDQFGN